MTGAAGAAAIFALAYLVNSAYVTVFYHRALAHRALGLPARVRRFVLATGPWVTGIDPKAWCALHRLHHRHADAPGDPHSPALVGLLAVAWAQLAGYEQMLRALIRGAAPETALVRDLDFDVHWLNRRRLWYLPHVAHAAIGVAIARATGCWPAGVAYAAGLLCHPVQGFLVNALGHAFGYRNFDTPDRSRNNTLVAWLVVGEGYQNNHHARPGSARFSARWWEIDAGWAICRLLAALRIVRLTGG